MKPTTLAIFCGFAILLFVATGCTRNMRQMLIPGTEPVQSSDVDRYPGEPLDSHTPHSYRTHGGVI